MAENRDQGAVPQGLIEQARARPVDPGRLQFLGKQAAALYTSNRTPLNDAVLSVIGTEDLGPEHARRVCEFANQEAFQREWEKGGSVRNVEFDGGPADPAVVLRELNDGARPATSRITDYDSPPVKTARADYRVEQEIFGKYASSMTHHSEVPSGMTDMHRLRQTMSGAQDHILSKLSSAEVTKEALSRELGDIVCSAVLSGDSLEKIAGIWIKFCERDEMVKEALDVVASRMRERSIPVTEIDLTKLAQPDSGRIPNTVHPVVRKFVEFVKIATQTSILEKAAGVLQEQLPEVEGVLAGRMSHTESSALSPMSMMPSTMGALHNILGGKK